MTDEFKPDWVNYRQGVADGRAEANADLRELLTQAGQVIAWQCFGDCRAFSAEPIPEPADVIAALKIAIEKIDAGRD